jgi:hypothetical protein
MVNRVAVVKWKCKVEREKKIGIERRKKEMEEKEKLKPYARLFFSPSLGPAPTYE